MRNISIQINTPSVSPIPIDVQGKLFFALHDWQSKYYGYKTRIDDNNAKGTPQVLRLLDSDNEEMECWWQELWFDALCYFAPGRSDFENERSWIDLTSSIKAYTNEWGTDKGFCCITKRNPGKQLAKQAHVSCGGNVFVGIPGKTKRFADGKLGQAILVLDRDYPITWDELRKNPLWNFFMHTSTVITKLIPTNYPKIIPSTVAIPSDIKVTPTKVDPFPHNQLEPTQITPVPMGSFTGETMIVNGLHCRIKYVHVDRVVSLPDEEYKISPFVR